MKIDGDLLFKYIVSLGTLAGLFWALVVWIRERAITRREKLTAKGSVVTQDITELKLDIKELKRSDIDQQADIMNVEKKIEQLDRDHHDFMMLMMGRKPT